MRRRSVALAVILTAAVACADSPTDPEEDGRIVVGTLEVSPDSALLVVGETLHLDLEIRDTTGAPLDRDTPAWSSSDSSVAQVDSLGVLAAYAPGSALITARAGDLERHIDVRVANVLEIRLIPPTDSLLAGERIVFDYEIVADVPLYRSPHHLTWSVDNRIAARIDADGVLSSLGAGSVDVTAAVGNAVGSAEVRIFSIDEPFIDIAAGYNHSCAARASGYVYCWGSTNVGALGVAELTRGGLTPYEPRPVPHDPEGPRLVILESFMNHVCGLTADGRAYCWGGTNGVLGVDGPATQTTIVPEPVATDLRFTSIATGWQHTCALDAEGAAYCWGLNWDGQLGDGTATHRSTPGPVAGGHRFADITAAAGHTCGVTQAGEVLCWGSDADGQIAGTGDSMCGISFLEPCALEPALIPGLPTMRRVAAAGLNDSFSCGIAEVGGSLHCWGGAFGAPSATDEQRSYGDLSASTEHLCGLTTAGTAWCVGSNAFGKMAYAPLGGGTTTEPVPVYGNLRFLRIDAGGEHTCGITGDGARVFCWGWNVAGQLGLGHTDPATVPTRVLVP